MVDTLKIPKRARVSNGENWDYDRLVGLRHFIRKKLKEIKGEDVYVPTSSNLECYYSIGVKDMYLELFSNRYY